MKQGEDINITEEQLDALYMYLNMYMDSMNEEEKAFWVAILLKIDREFYEFTNNRVGGLQDVQIPKGGA